MTPFAQSVMDWVNAGLAFVYPEVCQICQKERAGPREAYVCALCRSLAKVIEAPFCERCGMPYEGAITTRLTECAHCCEVELHFRSARSAVLGKEGVREAILSFKYKRALWFEPYLAELLISAAKPELAKEKWDFIVPVPLYPAREREREFNQAERLAQRLGKASDIPVNTRFISRIRPTPTQTQLNREERIANMKNALASNKGVALKGARIVLIDDVFTTGATTSACAKALKSVGAGDVCVWTVARGI